MTRRLARDQGEAWLACGLELVVTGDFGGGTAVQPVTDLTNYDVEATETNKQKGRTYLASLHLSRFPSLEIQQSICFPIVFFFFFTYSQQENIETIIMHGTKTSPDEQPLLPQAAKKAANIQDFIRCMARRKMAILNRGPRRRKFEVMSFPPRLLPRCPVRPHSLIIPLGPVRRKCDGTSVEIGRLDIGA
jgi:hypothetical protein